MNVINFTHFGSLSRMPEYSNIHANIVWTKFCRDQLFALHLHNNNNKLVSYVLCHPGVETIKLINISTPNIHRKLNALSRRIQVDHWIYQKFIWIKSIFMLSQLTFDRHWYHTGYSNLNMSFFLLLFTSVRLPTTFSYPVLCDRFNFFNMNKYQWTTQPRISISNLQKGKKLEILHARKKINSNINNFVRFYRCSYIQCFCFFE